MSKRNEILSGGLYLAAAMDVFSGMHPSGNMADWHRSKVPVKKDKKTAVRRKANKLARKKRKLNKR